MIVAVVSMRMMEVAADAVVDVIAVRDRLVAAAGAVDMAGLMTPAAMVRSAAVGVVSGEVDHVRVDMILMRVVEVTIMQIVDVAAVAHGRVGNPDHADERGRGGSVRSRWSRGIFLSLSRIRGHCGAALGRMIDSAADQRQHMLVGESVEDVPGLATPLDQTHRVQRLQTRGHGGNL
jgi:hypothetical protein